LILVFGLEFWKVDADFPLCVFQCSAFDIFHLKSFFQQVFDIELIIDEWKSQPSHRKRLKTAENKGFLTFLNAMGRSVPLKTPIRFQIANKINGFVHVSYGTALNGNTKTATQKVKQSTIS
jgi:hypothetical protein